MKNLFTVILFLALLVFTSVYVYADVWYVDRDKLVSGDGKSWGGAFKFIWEATQFEAQDGDEVWVKRGTHELISPILVITACEIYGGFAGWESMRSQRNPVANVTIIDGMNSVYHCFDVSDHCVIDGFTIKRANCNGASAPADRGGGIYIKSGADITVANCIFRNNSGKWGGGIWSNDGSDTTIFNCQFIDNHITYTGGAVYLRPGVVTIDKCDFLSNQGNYAGAVFSDASSTITDCYFESNTANDRGGALVNGWGSGASTVKDCVFIANGANYGGAIMNDLNSTVVHPKILNCTFYDNQASGLAGYGGAMYNTKAAPIITNCSFTSNDAKIAGAIKNELGCAPIITNCIFWGDTASIVAPEIHSDFDTVLTIDYCNIDQDGFNFLHNIRVPPNWAGGADFHLLPGSPCIDVGDNAASNIPAEDYEGDGRILDGDDNGTATADMGADEYVFGLLPPSPPTNPLPTDGAVGVSLATVLDWDDCTDATSYDVYFGDTSPPPMYGPTYSSEYYLPALNGGTTYFWQIVAKNAAGSTPGVEWDFTTCSLPGMPGSPTPGDTATGVTTEPVLSWSSTNADSYDVYFGDTSPPPFVANVSVNSYDPGTLNTFTTYSWKIVAKNTCGDITGPEWSFTTGSGIIEYTLTISAGAGGTTDPAPGSHNYSPGTPVEVDALPNPGYTFSYWSGDVPSGHENDNPVTITMDTHKDITANFIVRHWSRLTPDNPDDIDEGNIDANAKDDLIGDFGGLGLGLWAYYNNTSWSNMTGADADAIANGDIDNDGISEVVASFSSGTWTYDDTYGWNNISPQIAENLTCGDLDNNGQDEIIGDFGSLGLWSFDNNTSWRILTPDDATDVTTGDKNNDGMYEVVASFGALGLWTYANAS
ncbi:MAG: right-handed parallel beta-helix repeat-containing protein, partial [Candidatus Aminicenantes bacterium]